MSVMEFTSAAEMLAHNRAVRARFRNLVPIVEPEPVKQRVEIKYGVPGDAAVCGTYYREVPQCIPQFYSGSTVPKLDAVLRAVAEVYRVPVTDIISARRVWPIVRPRHVYFYLARHMTIRSLPEIGKFCGHKDHTTVLHGIRKIDALIRAGDPIHVEVEAVRSLIKMQFVPKNRRGVEILGA